MGRGDAEQGAEGGTPGAAAVESEDEFKRQPLSPQASSDPARSVTVAYHAGSLKPKTLRAVLRQAGLTPRS